MARSTVVAIVAGLALAPASSVDAAARGAGDLCHEELARLTASDAGSEDVFGNAVALHEGVALIGAHLDDDLGEDSGSAYVFVWTGTSWQQQAKLLAPDGAAGDAFGGSVAIEGDTALVGAAGDGDNGLYSGSVYVFGRSGSTWSFQQKLVPADNAAGDGFGGSIALSGDTALIGASGDDDNGPQSGAAYVYVRSSGDWAEEAKLRAPDGAAEDGFGVVALDGDIAVIGAGWDDDLGSRSGSAWVFERTAPGWTRRAKLLAADGAADDRFGSAVAVDGDTVVVGAYQKDGSVGNAGAAYVFEREGASWPQRAKLVAEGAATPIRFGYAVAVEGEVAVVGSILASEPGASSCGAAWAFARNGGAWPELAKLQVAEPEGEALLGNAVALHGELALVGSTLYDGNGLDLGAAYVFELPGRPGAAYCFCASGPCGNDDASAGCANSGGSGATLVARGTTLPDALDLVVSGGAPGQAAVLFQGDDAVMLPFGDGLRCAGGSVVRVTTPPLVLDAFGTAAFGPCFGDPSVSSITGVAPGSGETKRYQAWYRDPSGPCASTFNLSHGVEIIW